MTSTTLLPATHMLWDIAGVDGLQVMKALVGPAIDRISPFQSLETTLAGYSCSVLRLCEGNFRLAWQGEAAVLQPLLQQAQSGKRVWIKQLNWLSAIVLPDDIAPNLFAMAVPKPPHRLWNLPTHCAVPARINGISVLIWHHSVQEQPMIELHTALVNLNALQAALQGIVQISSNVE